MNIVVTGGAGYLGSVLVPKLLVRGHKVRVLDIGYFGVAHLRAFRPPVELIRDDIRGLVADAGALQKLLDGCDAVVHLAAVSNDPSADLNPQLTDEVNFQATRTLAEACKAKGIRFLFSSSCSVYGEADGEIDENGKVNPLTVYAVSKVKAEDLLKSMASRTWSPVILRNGTLYGYSPRMRFDLVVNIFSLYNTLHNEIRVFGDGLHWRPFLHVGDCARAFVHFAEHRDVAGVCFNISHENLRVVDLAEIFKRINPTLKVTPVPSADVDRRDYRVSTRRMKEAGFQTRVSVPVGAEELIEAIVSGLIPDPESIYYQNVKWLKELTQMGTQDHRQLVGLLEKLAAMRPQK